MFKEQNDNIQEEYGIKNNYNKNDYFHFKEGKNRVRILSGGTPIAIHRVKNQSIVCFGIKNGCPFHSESDPKASLKNVVYLLNKSNVVDGNIVEEIQIAEFPYKVTSAIDNLQRDEIWGFTELPMPYDIIINATNAGTKEVDYQTTPVPKDKSVELSQDILNELSKKISIADYVKLRKDKARAKVLGEKSDTTKGEDITELDDLDLEL
jgi:hypothetical protein